ncbi:MAG: carbohydrate ABC transporter permease [Nitrospira sp.]|nr:carbohydrate ABC transporter permease [Nitrospira sp.]MDH4370962.1 carbohydrate ABC transporter permease [Nitrospira sp.]MDH5497852.1 carbohydrate ABC transporter permease [Nitrospira sp.]
MMRRRDDQAGSTMITWLRTSGLTACVLLVVGLFCLGPVLWQAITSLKPDQDLVRLPPLLPERVTGVHYDRVLLKSSLPRSLANSMVVAASATVTAIVVGAFCAFALARLPIAGKSVILGVALVTSMFPPIAVISPLYLLMRELGLRDTLFAVGLTHAVYSLPLAVWLLTSFFQQLPKELYQAARIDGCTPLQAFLTVMLPLARPGLAVAGLLVFIYSWNEFMFALTLTASDTTRTAPVAVALFPGLYEIPWGDLAAASLVVTLPVAGLALVFQRHIIAGLTAGSVKG